MFCYLELNFIQAQIVTSVCHINIKNRNRVKFSRHQWLLHYSYKITEHLHIKTVQHDTSSAKFNTAVVAIA